MNYERKNRATKPKSEKQKEYMRIYLKEYYRKNKQKLDAYAKEWQQNNKEHYMALNRIKAKRWAQKHRAYRTALQIKREKFKLNRTPNWLTVDDLRFIQK